MFFKVLEFEFFALEISNYDFKFLFEVVKLIFLWLFARLLGDFELVEPLFLLSEG